MSKAGRKRMEGLREPSGRLSRRVMDEIEAHPPALVLRLVNDALRGRAAPEYGTEIGRLFLTGRLTAPEFEAGKRWDRLLRLYHTAIQAPFPDPKAMVLFAKKGTPVDVDSDVGADEMAWHRDIVQSLHEAHAIVLCHGKRAEVSFKRIVEGKGSTPVGVEDLSCVKSVLGSLAKYWGLTQNREAVRNSA